MRRLAAFWLEVLAIVLVALVLSVYLLRHKPPQASGAMAPAPVVRPAKKDAPVGILGEWVLVWAGSDWRMSLRIDGSYRCWSGSCVYVGTWHQDSTGALCVEERPEGGDHLWRWRVPMLRGKISGDALDPDGDTRATSVKLKRTK